MPESKQKKRKVYWVLQDNQVTPYMIDFFQLIRNRISDFAEIQFMVASLNKEVLKQTKELRPIPYELNSVSTESIYEGYKRKKDLMGNASFSQGLEFYKTLLLDDLGGGSLYQCILRIPKDERPAAVFIQIPTPLGSSEMEERVFYAWTHLCKEFKIPIIGYEMLPLDTRWTLAPSMMDALVVLYEDSYDFLTSPQAGIKSKVLLLPRFESKCITPASSPFWRNGMGSAYKYANECNIPQDRTILFLPHNVAMTYEYQLVLQHLSRFGKDLHLMFSIGKDQIRGTHSQKETIEIVYQKELKQMASYSFHDLTRPWEMTMADAVISCSSCFASLMSGEHGIPTLVYDEMVPNSKNKAKQKTHSALEIDRFVEKMIQSHRKRNELSLIILNLVKRS